LIVLTAIANDDERWLAGGRLIANAGNTMHGPALTQAMSFLASRGSEFPFVRSRFVIHRGRSSLSAVWESGDTAHPSYDWARDHHEPHFGLVENAAAMHDELMRAFRADVGPLDDQKAVEALTMRA
jgi:hypothetical protein